MIAIKRGEEYSHVIQHIRCKLRFSLLKATLIAVRGVRGRSVTTETEDEIGDICFNLIPHELPDD